MKNENFFLDNVNVYIYAVYNMSRSLALYSMDSLFRGIAWPKRNIE